MELLCWLEQHIETSLHPRPEVLKSFISNTGQRKILEEFLGNIHRNRLYIFTKSPQILHASLHPTALPEDSKTLVFLKRHQHSIITPENIDDEILYCDYMAPIMKQLCIESREIFLPLICADIIQCKSTNKENNQILYVLHNLLYDVEVAEQTARGRILLVQPIAGLMSAGMVVVNTPRYPALRYLLESTLISWMAHTKTLLSDNPIKDLFKNNGDSHPTPEDMLNVWNEKLVKLQSFLHQLQLPINQAVMEALQPRDTNPFVGAIHQIHRQALQVLEMCETVLPLFQSLWKQCSRIEDTQRTEDILADFQSLMSTLYSMWSKSKFCHQRATFRLILQSVCNFIINKAENIVDTNIFTEPESSQENLKDAQRICTNFRGIYLDFKSRADSANSQNGKLLKEALCNDVQELIATHCHFKEISLVAEIGGIGDVGTDIAVKEICTKYSDTIKDFITSVPNVMNVKEFQPFEIHFYRLRSISKLAISGTINRLVECLWNDILQLGAMFEDQKDSPPRHWNFSQETNHILWINTLINTTQKLMESLEDISPYLLEAKIGQHIKRHTEELMVKLESYKVCTIENWQNKVTQYHSDDLKQTLLKIEDYDESLQDRPYIILINLPEDFLKVLKEQRYLSLEPLELPSSLITISDILGDVPAEQLCIIVNRLQIVVHKYNSIFEMISSVELPFFEERFSAMDQLIRYGLEELTWNMTESSDFIESVTSLVCNDIYQCLDTLLSNSDSILEITASWMVPLPFLQPPDNQLPFTMEKMKIFKE
ncbi:hypothetical protein Ahia01_001231900 [Argonauta hians]